MKPLMLPLFAFCLLLSACAAHLQVRQIAVELRPFQGAAADRERLDASFRRAVAEYSENELTLEAGYTPQWAITPTVQFERGTFGLTTILHIEIRDVRSGKITAARSFDDTQIWGAEHREASVEALFEDAIHFIRLSLRVPVARKKEAGGRQ